MHSKLPRRVMSWDGMALSWDASGRGGSPIPLSCPNPGMLELRQVWHSSLDERTFKLQRCWLFRSDPCRRLRTKQRTSIRLSTSSSAADAASQSLSRIMRRLRSPPPFPQAGDLSSAAPQAHPTAQLTRR